MVFVVSSLSLSLSSSLSSSSFLSFFLFFLFVLFVLFALSALFVVSILIVVFLLFMFFVFALFVWFILLTDRRSSSSPGLFERAEEASDAPVPAARKTPPLSCVSTVFVAETPPLPRVLHCLRG